MSLREAVTVIVMLVCVKLVSSQSTRCTDEQHGEVRLVNGSVPNEGRVEVCLDSQWGTVCDDQWSTNDAKVVCRQLGYGLDGAQPLGQAYFGQGVGHIVLSNVRCNPYAYEQSRLVDCAANDFPMNDYCTHNKDAGVRCYQSRVTDINVTTVNGPKSEYVTALITWEIQNSTVHIDRLTRHQLTCNSINESHIIEVSLSKKTMLVHLGGFYLSTSYTCCVSEVYDCFYVTRRVCTVFNTISDRLNIVSITITGHGTDSTPAAQASNTIGWALGGIIIVLLLLLVLLVIAIVHLLRPGLRKKVLPTKTSQSVDTRLSITVKENISYVTTTSSQFTTEQEVRATDQLEVNTNPSYSSIGQVYDVIVSDSNARRHQQEAGISIDETQRHTFSERHAGTDSQVTEEDYI